MTVVDTRDGALAPGARRPHRRRGHPRDHDNRPEPGDRAGRSRRRGRRRIGPLPDPRPARHARAPAQRKAPGRRPRAHARQRHHRLPPDGRLTAAAQPTGGRHAPAAARLARPAGAARRAAHAAERRHDLRRRDRRPRPGRRRGRLHQDRADHPGRLLPDGGGGEAGRPPGSRAPAGRNRRVPGVQGRHPGDRAPRPRPHDHRRLLRRRGVAGGGDRPAARAPAARRPAPVHGPHPDAGAAHGRDQPRQPLDPGRGRDPAAGGGHVQRAAGGRAGRAVRRGRHLAGADADPAADPVPMRRARVQRRPGPAVHGRVDEEDAGGARPAPSRRSSPRRRGRPSAPPTRCCCG